MNISLSSNRESYLTFDQFALCIVFPFLSASADDHSQSALSALYNGQLFLLCSVSSPQVAQLIPCSLLLFSYSNLVPVLSTYSNFPALASPLDSYTHLLNYSDFVSPPPERKYSLKDITHCHLVLHLISMLFDLYSRYCPQNSNSLRLEVHARSRQINFRLFLR